MVGLSITLGCPIRPDVFERYIPAQRGGFREIMEALIRFRSGEAMHDAVAISTLLDDRLMTWQTGEITVELAPPERSGQTVLHPSEHADMRAAVQLIAGRAQTECSGNVTKENIARLKDIGVDFVSSGALTHSAPILDLSMKHLRPLEKEEA